MFENHSIDDSFLMLFIELFNCFFTKHGADILFWCALITRTKKRFVNGLRLIIPFVDIMGIITESSHCPVARASHDHVFLEN